MNKRKLLLVALSLCMVAILAMGGTLAYLTDTDNQTNTFTMGKVDIWLDEAVITKGEDDEYTGVMEDGSRTTEEQKLQNYKLFPGDVVTKDPTIWVEEDSEDSWIAAKMVIKGNLWKLIGVNPGSDGVVYDTLDITKIISGGDLFGAGGVGYNSNYNGLFCFETGNAYLHQVVVTKDVVVDDPATEADESLAPGEWEIYVFMKEHNEPGTHIELFDTVTIPTAWNNAEAALFNGSSVDIYAYAVQADGFVDAYEAMHAAFGAEFVNAK